MAVEANNKRQAVTFILKPEIRNKIIVLSTTEACEFQFVNNLGNRFYLKEKRPGSFFDRICYQSC